jgi:hypothetical protein
LPDIFIRMPERRIMGMRDDFKLDVKDILAKRVGMRCSNPNCRQFTSGPQEDPRKALNIGVAAHITAAAAKGPRYDKALTPDGRRSPENGIWLCQNCGKLADNDPARYTAGLLRQWKRLSEEAALLDVESPAGAEVDKTGDEGLIRFYAQCFDRPAFQDHFRQEGSMEAFDKAIEDTITALNTGCLRARDGAILAQAKGKAYLRNADRRGQMDTIGDLLRAIRSRYDDARKRGLIHSHDQFYCFHDRELAEWMDETRRQVLAVFGEVCKEAGVPAPYFPRPVRHWRGQH